MNLNDIKLYAKEIFAELVATATSKTLIKRHLSTSLYKNAYYLIAGAVVTAIFGLIFWVIAARLYSAEAVGLGSAVISALGLLALISNLGLAIGIFRFLPSAGDKSVSMINTCITLTGLTSIVISLIFLSGLNIWSPALTPIIHSSLFLISFIIFALVWALDQIISTPFLAKRASKYNLTTSLIMSLLKVILIVPFAAIFHGAFGIIVSTGIAFLVVQLISVFWLMNKIIPGYHLIPVISKKVLGDIFGYSIGNYVAKIFMDVTPFILPLIVINVLGSEMNAYFYMAWSFVQILAVIPVAISNSLFAEASNDEKSLHGNITKSLKITFLLLIPVIIVITIFSNQLLLLFGASYSANGASLMRIMVFSTIPLAINHLYLIVVRVNMEMKSIILVSASLTFLVLGLSWLLMFLMGNLLGVGIGYLAGQCILATMTASSLMRRNKTNTLIDSLGKKK